MNDADDRSPSERRLGVRYFACFPAHVQLGSGRKRTALIRDLSVSGALLLTQQPLTVGSPITLRLFIYDASDASRVVTGIVMRAETINGAHELWTQRVGVRFDESMDDIEPVVRSLMEKQTRAGLTR